MLRAFEEAIGRAEEVTEEAKEVTEAIGKPEVEVTESSIRAFAEPVGGAEETSVKEKRGTEKAKGKVEARLEFLARMYEAKKTKQAEEEPTVEDAEAVEE